MGCIFSIEVMYY